MQPGTSEWLDQVTEPIIEPDLPIIDPHHHLWPEEERCRTTSTRSRQTPDRATT